MSTVENLPQNGKVKLLMGQFSFLEENIDGVFKAIIHQINGVFECDTIDEAEELGEAMLSDYESYLVPASYKGEIDLTEIESIGDTL